MKEMPKIAAFAAAALLCASLALSVSAKELTDRCDHAAPVPGTQYFNLGDVSGYISFVDTPGFPDSTALGLENYSREGAVVLEAPRAQRVTVALYSRDKSTYGVLTSGGCSITSAEAGPYQELVFSPSTGKVYWPTGEGLGKEMAYNKKLTVYSFPGQAVPLPKDAVRYGLNLSVSADGASYQPVAVQLLQGQRYSSVNGALYYETYQADLPPATRFLKVAVNDFATVFNEDGTTGEHIIPYAVGLASISVTVPDEPPPEPVLPPSGGSVTENKPSLRPPNSSKPKEENKESEEEEEGTFNSAPTFGGNTSVYYYSGGSSAPAPVKGQSKAVLPQNNATAQQPAESAVAELPLQPVPQPQAVAETTEEGPEEKTKAAALAAAVAGASGVLLCLALVQKGLAARKREKAE